VSLYKKASYCWESSNVIVIYTGTTEAELGLNDTVKSYLAACRPLENQNVEVVDLTVVEKVNYTLDVWDGVKQTEFHGHCSDVILQDMQQDIFD